MKTNATARRPAPLTRRPHIKRAEVLTVVTDGTTTFRVLLVHSNGRRSEQPTVYTSGLAALNAANTATREQAKPEPPLPTPAPAPSASPLVHTATASIPVARTVRKETPLVSELIKSHGPVKAWRAEVRRLNRLIPTLADGHDKDMAKLLLRNAAAQYTMALDGSSPYLPPALTPDMVPAAKRSVKVPAPKWARVTSYPVAKPAPQPLPRISASVAIHVLRLITPKHVAA